jgi:hypothetical protein
VPSHTTKLDVKVVVRGRATNVDDTVVSNHAIQASAMVAQSVVRNVYGSIKTIQDSVLTL